MIVKFTQYCQQNHLKYIVNILYISQILLRANIRTQNSDFQICIQYTAQSWEETHASFLNLCIPRTQNRYCWLSCADALEERTASAQESVSGKHICYREGKPRAILKKTTTKKKDPRWTSSQNTADVYRFKTVTVTRESISEAKKDFSSSRSHLSPHTSPCWVQSGHRCGHSTLDRRPCQGAGGRTSTDTKHEVELLLKAPEALDFIRTHLQGSGHPLSPPHDAADHSPSDKRGEAAEKMLHHSWLGVSSRHAMWPADTLPYCWGLGAKAGRSMVGEPDQSLVP